MINLSLPETETQQTSTTQLRPRITVFGVGGAGGNAVNNMIRANLEGVDFVVANTDAQALHGSLAPKCLQLGTTITRGLGAGSRPDVGRAAAEEQIEDVLACLENANMVFITGGMGGGTGTGAAPVIARAARERGILTVGVVTKPFHFEGAHRMRLAESGIADLQQYVDTLIIIPNQNLFRIANEKTTFADAFKMADDVLHSGVRGVTDLMIMPGLINLDFADIRSVMTEMGKAMMGTGEASGDRRALDAAEAAISNPLLDDVSMKGARGVLINITGGYDMTLFEVDEAANRIRDEVDPDANIIFGSTFDQVMEGRMRVSVVATGIDAALSAQAQAQARGNSGVGMGAGMGMAAPGGAPTAAPAPAQAPAQAQAHQAPLPTAGLPPVMDRRRLGVPGVPPAVAASREAVRPGDYHAAMMQAPMAPGGAPAPLPNTYASPVHPAPARAAEHEPMHDTGGMGRYEQAAEAQMTAAAADLRMPLRSTEQRTNPMGAPQPARPNTNGPLRGERRESAFIAPRPADPGPRQAALNNGPDTMRGDGADMDKPRKRTTLFEKMTGIGSVARRFMTNDGGDMAPAPSRQAPLPGPAARPASHHPVSAAPQQQPRAGIEPTERSRMNQQTEEDMLDIPAFLRRQAN